MFKKGGLGRGVEALISPIEDAPVFDKRKILEIEINQIEPGKGQPRKDFDKEELEELAKSIKQYGMLSPIIVKKELDYFFIVAGERRWRAARMAGLKAVPAIIRDFSGSETIEVALIENIQRADLNPLEEAASYKRLIDEFSFTQEKISEKIGKSRSAVANSLRLLNLPEKVRGFISDNLISTGHAKVILSITDEESQIILAEKIIEEGLSVRETEIIAAQINDKKNSEAVNSKKKTPLKENSYSYIETELNTVFGTKVNIKSSKNGNKGKIEIEFFSKDELDRLFLLLKNRHLA